jgi:hypothetical protein
MSNWDWKTFDVDKDVEAAGWTARVRCARIRNWRGTPARAASGAANPACKAPQATCTLPSRVQAVM